MGERAVVRNPLLDRLKKMGPSIVGRIRASLFDLLVRVDTQVGHLGYEAIPLREWVAGMMYDTGNYWTAAKLREERDRITNFHGRLSSGSSGFGFRSDRCNHGFAVLRLIVRCLELLHPIDELDAKLKDNNTSLAEIVQGLGEIDVAMNQLATAAEAAEELYDKLA